MICECSFFLFRRLWPDDDPSQPWMFQFSGKAAKDEQPSQESGGLLEQSKQGRIQIVIAPDHNCSRRNSFILDGHGWKKQAWTMAVCCHHFKIVNLVLF